ncbi:MAG: hypothetical protein ACOX74_04295 [Lachnospiraceae bacterium]
MDNLIRQSSDYIYILRTVSEDERRGKAEEAFRELEKTARKEFGHELDTFRDNLPDLMSLVVDHSMDEKEEKSEEAAKPSLKAALKATMEDTARSMNNEKQVLNLTADSEKQASRLVRDMRTLGKQIAELRAVSGENALADGYASAASAFIAENIWTIWNERIYPAYDKDDMPSDQLWTSVIDLTSYCIGILEECIRLTRDERTMENVQRYEHLIRLHDFSINSAGWAYDMMGSNVNMTAGFGRSWHVSKTLEDREIKVHRQKIDEYNRNASAIRQELADRAYAEEKNAHARKMAEDAQAQEKYHQKLKKQDEENRQHAEAAEKYLQEGNRRMAAVEYWKGMQYGKAREICDFRTLIAAGQSHTLGLMPDGSVKCAGDGMDGGGNDTKVCRVGGWKNIVAVSASSFSSIGLSVSGSAVTAGYNRGNNLSVALWHDVVQVSAGLHHTVGLQKSGYVSAVGNNGYKQCATAGWKDIREVSAGAYHTLGLRNNGTVVSCGAREYGRCDTDDWRDIIMIAAGGGHSVGLRADGTVVACGQNDEGQCNVQAWRDIVSIAAGNVHTVGIRRDGTVVACGLNDRGQCSVKGIRGAVAAAASNHTVVLCEDGTVVCVGDNRHRQNKTAKWNLFSMNGLRGKGLNDAALRETVEELNELKETYRHLGRLAFRRRKEVWSKIQELEKTISGAEDSASASE